MRKVIFFLLLLPIAISATPAQQLAKLLGNLHTMEANFQQLTTSKPPQYFSGKMVLARPGKFRWEVTKPSEQLIVVAGKQVWIYYKDLHQVIKRNIDYSQPGNPAMLLSGSIAQLQRLFTITTPKSGEFKLAPKQKGVLHTITLLFTTDKLTAIKMADNLGQNTTFKFTNIRINHKISPQLFQFKAPHGVDVVTE